MMGAKSGFSGKSRISVCRQLPAPSLSLSLS